MLSHCDLIAFIATVRSDQTKPFYSEVLGLHLVEESPFALVYDAHGTMLRVQKVETFYKAEYTVLGWRVDDIREAVEMLRKRGIRFEHYPGLPQDEQGIWTTPDGNTLSLTEIRQA